MMISKRMTAFGLTGGLLLSTTALAQTLDDDWIGMSDAEFAAAYADMAFAEDLTARQTVAWMWFARLNQQIAGPGIRVDRDTGTVPLWMAWPTDPETFTETPDFTFSETPRADPDFVTAKDVLAGRISVDAKDGVPNGGSEEVTRNEVGYRYIVDNGMNTYFGLLAHVQDNRVDMPVGSVETKISWQLVTASAPAPEGAMVFTFTDADGYRKNWWWAGMHIMAKMRPLPDDPFYSEEPSWFWTTFQFTDDLGVSHVRDAFMTQNVPIGPDAVAEVLAKAGIEGIGYEDYSPNGTQIRFTAGGDGKTPVILGHTRMEDFAGRPDASDPTKWLTDSTSCHTCHATAAINPQTGNFFPFSVPVGTLTPYYTATGTTTQDCNATAMTLGDNYVSLDFMWPFVFQTAPYSCASD